MKKAKRKTRQKHQPPRRRVVVMFPSDLFEGVEAIAEMENWTLSKTVVEIVRLTNTRRKR